MTSIGYQEVANVYKDPGSASSDIVGQVDIAAATALNEAVSTQGSADRTLLVTRATVVHTPGIARGLLTRLRADIVAAGGTVADSQLAAAEPALERLVRSSAFPKLKELGLFLGDSLTGSLIKVLGATTRTMTGVGLVAGDYTTATGITGNAASKAINTGFNPTSAGCTANSWGFGVCVTSLTQAGILAGHAAWATGILNLVATSQAGGILRRNGW